MNIPVAFKMDYLGFSNYKDHIVCEQKQFYFFLSNSLALISNSYLMVLDFCISIISKLLFSTLYIDTYRLFRNAEIRLLYILYATEWPFLTNA